MTDMIQSFVYYATMTGVSVTPPGVVLRVRWEIEEHPFPTDRILVRVQMWQRGVRGLGEAVTHVYLRPRHEWDDRYRRSFRRLKRRIETRLWQCLHRSR